MKKIIALAMVGVFAGCASAPKMVWMTAQGEPAEAGSLQAAKVACRHDENKERAKRAFLSGVGVARYDNSPTNKFFEMSESLQKELTRCMADQGFVEKPQSK